MPRRRKASSDINLDSLLDTLFNVVGILVLILVMVVLEAASVVKRTVEQMKDVPKVSIEEMEDLQDQLKRLQEILKQLEVDKEKADDPLVETNFDEAKLKQLIAQLEASLAKLPEMKYNLAEVQKSHEERAEEAKKLSAQMDAARKELARLKALLAQTPDREAPPDIEVSIPQPRDAPPNVSRRTFLCRGGRLVEYREKVLENLAISNVRKFKNKEVEETKTHLGGLPGPEVQAYFERLTIGRPYYKLEILPYYERGNPWVYVAANFTEGAGDTVESIKSGQSTIEGILKGLNNANQYAYFEVWEDSFDVYLEARKVAEKYNVLAGWKPIKLNENEPWTKRLRLPSEYRFVIERPKPKPPAPAKPAPKPAPKPSGPAPPKPLEEAVID